MSHVQIQSNQLPNLINPLFVKKTNTWQNLFVIDLFYSVFHYSGFYMIYTTVITQNIPHLLFAIVWIAFCIFHHRMFLKDSIDKFLHEAVSPNSDVYQDFKHLTEINSIKLNRDLFIESGIEDETPKLVFKNKSRNLNVHFILNIKFVDNQSRICYQQIANRVQAKPEIASRLHCFKWEERKRYGTQKNAKMQNMFYFMLIFSLEWLLFLYFRETQMTIQIVKRIKMEKQ